MLVPNALYSILTFFLKTVFRLLPAKVRYSMRYLSKSIQRMHVLHIIRSRPLPTTTPKDENTIMLRPLPRVTSNNDGAIDLAHFLCYDILVLVASRIHYLDLLNLSLVSRGIRQIIFSDPVLPARFKYFRTITCKRTKFQFHCWICNIPICGVGYSSRIPDKLAHV